jgi:hypothetical protein
MRRFRGDRYPAFSLCRDQAALFHGRWCTLIPLPEIASEAAASIEVLSRGTIRFSIWLE